MPKVPQDIIDERFDRLFEVQREIARNKNEHMIGKVIKVMVEGEHPETELLIQGRYTGQAPDIDGHVYINDTNDQPLDSGQMVFVEITEVLEFDLIGGWLKATKVKKILSDNSVVREDFMKLIIQIFFVLLLVVVGLRTEKGQNLISPYESKVKKF